jgi:phage tail-like protein
MAVQWTPDKLKSSNKGVGDFNQAHRFSVELDGVMVGGIHTVEGLDHETEVIEAHDGEDHTTHYAPGRQKAGVVKITKDFTSTKEFITWRQTVIDGKTERKSVSIILLTPSGEESIRYNLFDAWPSKYDGPVLNARNSANATEALHLRFERMEMK